MPHSATKTITTSFSVLHPNYYPDSNFYEQFEPWQKLQIENGQPAGGIYKLKTQQPISRLIGRDPEGILYIGHGIILGKVSNLKKLVNALNQVEFEHEAGVRYHFGKIPHRYPLTELSVMVELCNTPEHMAKKELEAYEYKFGELPPLNREVIICIP